MKTKTTRKLTICSTDNKGSSVILKGKWLKESGFSPGDVIEIDTSKKGKLTIKNKGNKFTK